MTPPALELMTFFDYPATFTWALTGGLIAARQRLDVTGVAVVALLTATGGGLLRDGLFLQISAPTLIRTPAYLMIVLAATLIVAVAGDRVIRLPGFERVVAAIDAVGIGAYAVVGTQLALGFGFTGPAAIFVGVVNAVGGGMLRDIVLRQVPQVVRPGTPLALAALAGGMTFLATHQVVGIAVQPAGIIAIGVVFTIRLGSLRYQWQTMPIRGFDERVQG